MAPEGTAFAGAGSPFQSYGSESSTTSAAREYQPSAGGPSAAAAPKPPGAWDPAASLPSLDSIWGGAPQEQAPAAAQIPLLPPSNRSRSRFPFAQGSEDLSSSGRLAAAPLPPNGPVPSFSPWVHGSGGDGGGRAADPAGAALLRQLQSGPNGTAHFNGYGNGHVNLGGAYIGEPEFSLQPGPRAYQMIPTPNPQKAFPPRVVAPAAGGPPGFAEQQQLHMQQQQHNGFHAGPNGMAVPPSQLGPEVQALEAVWLDTNQRFRNMAV